MPIVQHKKGPADQLLEHLEAIPEFQPAVQESTLLNSLLATEHLSPFEQFFKDAKRTASVINGVDCHTRLQTLGSASLGTMIPQIQDQFGFQQTCDQAKATNYNITLIQDLIVPLFGKHVNDHLSNANFQSLDQFKNQPELVNRFTELITADTFPDQLLGRSNNNFAIATLFTHEYLAKGPDFSVPKRLEECASVEVVANWARRLLDQAVALPADEVAKQIETHVLTLAQAASSIYNPTGRSDLHILDYARAMQAADQLLQEHHLTQLGDKIKDALLKGSQGGNEDGLFSEANLHAWQALSNNVWNAWDFSVRDTGAGGQWKAAVQGAETHEDVQDTPNGGDIRHVHRTQTWGRVVRDWLQVNVNQGFVNSQNFGSIHNSAHSFARVDPPETHSSCFAPGTRVLTDLGDMPIENLREHSRVVTRLSNGLIEWGSCSDEKVRMPSPKVLYGFNDDAAFFTAGHVFFTTTGLRAVSPELATAENPWCNPGQLRAGHVLLHTSDGKTYSKHLIRSIHSERSTGSYVYGVHLREGLRSYHANGFLVALNYPEITVASLAKQLMQVPRKERLDLIGKLRELKPILDRFGGETTLQALERESSSEALHYTGPRHHRRFHLRHVNYPYRMTMEDGKRGPAVDLVEGVLFVDGQYCERASIEKDHVSWSRPLSDGKWEYAACHFSNKGLNGSGFMHVNDHPDVVDKKDHNTLMSESPANPFFLAVSTENHPGAHAMSNASGGQLTWDIMYDPKPDEGTNEDDPDVVTLCTEDLGRVVKKDSNDNYSPYPIKDLQIYDGLLERIAVKAKESLNDSGAEALKGMNSLYKRRTWYDVTSGAQNYEWVLAAPEAIIHNSDQFAQFETDHKAWEDKADANAQEPQLSLRDLTFEKSLGTDFKLKIPMLINSISTVWTSNGSEFTGKLRGYDPLGDGNNGTTHLVAGSRTAEPPLFFAAVRAASETSSTVPIHEAHAPAPRLNIHLLKITRNTTDKKIEALAKTSHDQKEINRKTEEIIKKVMLYHMEDKEREMFFKVEKPTDLDPDFADSLDTTCGKDTKEWFKKTYARAYICQILTQHSIGLDGAQKFTETEKRNIRYFWNGHGTSCLSREDRYKTLEKKIARKLILATVLSNDPHDTIENTYVKDRGGTGGDYWSEAVLAYYNHPDTLKDHMNPSVGNGDNLLTKMAAIMDALDQGLERTGDEKHLSLNSTNSNILCYASNKANLGDVWSQQFMDLHAKDKQAAEEELQEMWFEESLALIVEDLLSNSDLVSGDLNKGLQEDVQKLRDEMGIQADTAKKDQAKSIAKMFGASAKGMIKLLVATRRGIASAFWKAASYMRGIPVIGRGIDWIWKKAKSEPGAFFTEGKERMFKGIMLVGSIAFMGWSLFKAFNPDKATGKSQWDSSGPVEKAQTILNAFAMTKSIAEFGTDFTEICLRIKKPGTFSRSAEAAVDATLDAMAQRKLATEWVYFEKGSDGVATTKVQSFLETADTVDEIAQAEGNIGSALPASGEVGFNCTEEMIKACSKLKRAFNIARKALSCVGYVLAIAVAVFMTWKLIQDWDGMDTWHRTIDTIQVVCAALEAIASVVMIVVTFGAGAAFAATMSAIFTAFTLVLLAIVVLAMIILAIWEATRPPPESPISQWIDNIGKHIETWCPGLSAPLTPLTVSSNVPDSRLRNSGDAQEVDIVFTNTGAQAVTLDAIELQFDVGPDKSAFFTEAEQINKKPEGSSLSNHQFEVSVNGSASLSVADAVNMPKSQSVKANEKPDAFTVQLTVTGATGELDAEGHCPFELQPNNAVVFKIKAISNIQVTDKVDVGVTWRQFWNQKAFDQDEDIYWFTRDK